MSERERKTHTHDKKRKREDDYRDKHRGSKKTAADNSSDRRHRHEKKRKKSSLGDAISHRSSHSHQDKASLYPLGPISHKKVSEDQQIDADRDYFAFHNHLRVYLYRNKKGAYFEDLSSSEARAVFAEFCHEYNNGRLEMAFYDSKHGLPNEALDECKRTKHAWNFHTSELEKKTLDVVKDGVRKQTEYNSKDR